VQQTLATVASCLKPGGVCLATVVDYRALAQLARQASTFPSAEGVSFGNGAFEVSLTTGAATQLQALVQEYENNKMKNKIKEDTSESEAPDGKVEPWGIEYLFSLGDAVQVCVKAKRSV